MTTDHMRTLEAARAQEAFRLELTWSDGARATVDLTATLKSPAFAALRDADVFRQVAVDEWGHNLFWPDEIEIGADTLWLETLTVLGRDDTRAFLEWRLRNALSLSGAAEALGISRRMVAYYANGEKVVPRSILLACRGWEALQAA